MLWVEFKPTISAFELAKTLHALESAATVIGGVLEVGGQRQAPAALPPEKETQASIRYDVWVDPRVGLHDLEKNKFLTLLILELRSSTP
jgi:hypothetical protein